MSTRADNTEFDLDGALARLAAEAAPRPALSARVLADAAMVTAERQPAVAPKKHAAAGGGWLERLFGRPGWSIAGVAATLGLSLALGLGFGLNNESEVLTAAGIEDVVVSELSPLDGLEREVLAAVDEDFFGFDAPL